MQLTIKIPDDLQFADLELARTSDGSVSLNWDPIERICNASDIDISIFRDQSENNVAGLIIQWYAIARENGEPPDATADDLILEAMLEDKFGGGISHKPGTS